MKILEINNVCFTYERLEILHQANLSIEKGQFVLLQGPNGAGKSTLLKLILGELTPLKGQISLYQTDVKHFKNWDKISYVPQSGYQHLAHFPATVSEIVATNLYNRMGRFRFPGQKEAQAIRDALEAVDMQAYAKRMIGELSGGQRQRVLLAKALISKPELLILDEPVSGIDAKNTLAFYQLLKHLNQEEGLTVLMVTHDIGGTFALADKHFCIEEGNLLELSREVLEKERLHRHVHTPGACHDLHEPISV